MSLPTPVMVMRPDSITEPRCAACNASKCNEEVTHWMRRKRLDERTFLTRYIEIRASMTQAVL